MKTPKVRTCFRVLLLASCIWLGIPESLILCQTPDLVVVEHADSLVGKIIDGEEARELIGGVRFSHEQVHVLCDRATQMMRSGKVILTGNVIVHDDSVTMRAPRGVYYKNERRAEAFDGVTLDDGKVTLTARNGQYSAETKKAFFWSDVVVRDTGSTITADSLMYDRIEKYSVARRNVTVHELADNVTITGGYLENWSEKQASRMKENPVLFNFDTTAGKVDTLVVYSRVMESHRGEPRRLIAIDSVRIVRTELAAIAGLAQFAPRGDSLILRSAPVVWFGETQISGDSINVYMKSRVLDRVVVLGNAFGASKIDSLGLVRFDQLTGETMQMSFADKRLQRVDVETRAISLYHLFEDSAANGLNKTSGDRVIMSFAKGKLVSINVSGGVEGQYIPENLLRGREETYQLSGFVWRDDRPKIHVGDVMVSNAGRAR